MQRVNVLLSGVGSPIGLGATRLLAPYSEAIQLSACNVKLDCAARVLVPNLIESPDFYFARTATADDYLDFVRRQIRDRGIQAIITCSIFELKALARAAADFASMGARVLVEDLPVLEVFMDKSATAQAIIAAGGCAPRTVLLADSDGQQSDGPDLSFPYIIKPQFGYGSRGVAKIESPTDFRRWTVERLPKHAPFVAQEYLPSADSEYGCTAIYGRTGGIASNMAILRESIEDGVTAASVYHERSHVVEAAITSLAEKLPGRYALNFQLRLEDNQACVFEVNPRFGAAEPLRAAFGQDPYLTLLRQYFPSMPAPSTPRRYGRATMTPSVSFVEA